jgi:hypothetical protein
MFVATIRGLAGLMLASFVSTCALLEVGAGRADWWVDAEALPLPPETTVIHGFLQERECASGGSPEGRIVGPRVEYGPEAIVVTFRVRSVGGGTCPSNPLFPVTIELTEPLGGRALLDGGVNPPRDATIDPTIVLAPEEDCGPLVGTDDTKIACLEFLNATLGDRYAEFARVSVAVEAGDCPGNICTTADEIEARAWRVEGTDRQGRSFAWLCSYADEVASCHEIPG